MEFMSAKEAADKWGISQRRISSLCMEDRIDGAQRVGNMWIIPIDARKPVDARNKKQELNSGEGAKPFLKWAGGKSQLLKEIGKYYPFDGKKITRYAEPFVGGGAVFFDIMNKYDIKEAYINDISAELMNTYKVIRDNVAALLQLLHGYEKDYVPLEVAQRKAYYAEKRNRFNSLVIGRKKAINIEKAALMIFLNKTCFNGLYRVNKRGMFNVPIGEYKRPLICDEKNLLAVAGKLQNVVIDCADYKRSEKFIDDHTFVYFDPPYRPLNTTSSFTAYTENLFTNMQHVELAMFVMQMKRKGARVLVSNSDPANVNKNDEFFDTIYSRLNIHRVEATRMINSKGTGRGKISELLISD